MKMMTFSPSSRDYHSWHSAFNNLWTTIYIIYDTELSWNSLHFLFLRQGQSRRVDKEDSDVETTTDEETEVELEKNFKIDTEDEFDLADFSDEENKTLQASARVLSAGEKARDNIMQWTDKDLDMDDMSNFVFP